MRTNVPFPATILALAATIVCAQPSPATTPGFDTELEYAIRLEGSQPSFPRCIASGDVDLDGDIDLVVSDRRNFGIRIMLNCGNGSYPHSIDIGDPNSSHHRIIALDDLDADGDLDIVAAGPAARVHRNLGRTAEGDWLGFDHGHSYPAGIDPHWISTGDLNGDDRTDLLVANFGFSASRSGWSLLLNHGDDGFASVPGSVDPLLEPCLSIVAVDLDADDDLDIAVATQSGRLLLYENLGHAADGTWAGVALHSTMSLDGQISSIRQADLDGDAIPDLVASHRSRHHFTIIESDSPWSFQIRPLDCQPDVELVDPVDLDGDDIPELSLLSRTTGSIHLLARQTNGDYLPLHSTPPDTTGEAKFLTHADLDGDGDTDYAIVYAHPAFDGGSVKTGFNQAIQPTDSAAFIPCESNTWIVDEALSGDFTTIQDAVDAAADGDVVIVLPGRYTGTGPAVVDMLGKAIQLRTSASEEPVTIDGQSVRRGIVCISNETNLTTIDGFTFADCHSDDEGGGMHCIGSRPLVRNCTFSSSCTAQHGAAIFFRDASGPRLINCRFDPSTATASLHSVASSLRIEECRFLGGDAYLSDSNLLMLHSRLSHNPGPPLTLLRTDATIDHCLVSENAATAIVSDPGVNHTVTIRESHFCQNLGDHIVGTWVDAGGNHFLDACSHLCPGDTNEDRTADVVDMLLIISHWGTDHDATDLDRDGATDVSDLLIVLGHWGTCD